MFPIINKNLVYHVGYLDFANKEKGSLEGSGLSVSEQPEAWTKIAKLGGRPLQTFQKEDGQFLDFYALTEEQKETIRSWGVEKGYLLKTDLYRSYFYDEDEEEFYFESANYEEVKKEAEDESDIEKRVGYTATEKLHEQEMIFRTSPRIAFELVAAIYAENVLEIDGAWFNEKLDPYAYSAPRGVIRNQMIHTWKKNLPVG